MPLKQAKLQVPQALETMLAERKDEAGGDRSQAGRGDAAARDGAASPWRSEDRPCRSAAALDHGAVVIAAITSCTNTSNPSVMIGAGLLAKKRRRSAG